MRACTHTGARPRLTCLLACPMQRGIDLIRMMRAGARFSRISSAFSCVKLEATE